MKTIVSIAFIGILFLSCPSVTKSQTKHIHSNTELQTSAPSVALKFINDYVDYCNKPNNSIDILDWVSANPNASKSFKMELKRIINEARKDDPELGLGFDPIFDAQDYPDEGFELRSYEKSSGYLVVAGKKWKTFHITMKITKENDKWLVDGSGIVNIPKAKQRKR